MRANFLISTLSCPPTQKPCDLGGADTSLTSRVGPIIPWYPRQYPDEEWAHDISWSNQSKAQDFGLMVESGKVLSCFELE